MPCRPHRAPCTSGSLFSGRPPPKSLSARHFVRDPPTSHGMASPPFDIARYRAQIPILEHAIPLNNCSQAPLSEVTQAAATRFLESWNRHGMDWDAWMEEVEAAR